MRNAAFVFLFSFVCSAVAYADETSELEQAMRQLESAKQALIRAQKSANAGLKSRLYFDYQKAHQDINTVKQGINLYINGDRAQPRDPRKLKSLSGYYDKLRKN
ncbi:RAQPRD family integrative conjugative element protein [Rodentibacter caecimuris]|uniref:integrative conjugative element protein, RAQPRD family n=1 Tax=Rodentibacter caecimuris TaxID=1796644 RepID=UPI0013A0AB0F|nr:RAQPRD family integrative conjugative element protein [Rodentibacter heylii]QIA76791.1 conjugal transfer protein [Rodentibacter heylii]